jgi:hypothetical protein
MAEDTAAGSQAQDRPRDERQRAPEGQKHDQPKDRQQKTGQPRDGQHKDERTQPERGEQFAKAISDPLARVLGGGTHAAEGEAYQSWMKVRSAAATFVSGSSIGVLNISTAAAPRSPQPPGPIDQDLLEQLTGRYVPVAGYETFLNRLRESRLLVLRGAQGTGRVTTALRLLAEVAEHVSRFGSDTNLRSLDDTRLEAGCGYVIELLSGTGRPPLSAADTDDLREQLTSSECYLVIVAPHDIRHQEAFERYVADYRLPDPGQVIARVIEQDVGDDPDLAALCKLAAGVSANRALTPFEMVWVGQYIASHTSDELTPGELARTGAEALSRHVSAWFDPLADLPTTAAADEQVRLAAFRIALAVLHGTPYHLVAEAGEALTLQILTTLSARRSPGRPVFGGHRDDYLANSRAGISSGTVKLLDTGIPAELASYDDDRMPFAILRHVWSVHNVRGPLITWLQELSTDPRPIVFTRAALAIGLLSSWDFTYSLYELIAPWAESSEEVRHRWVAAVALDEASRNDQIRQVIGEIVEDWCRHGSYEQRWTGATALGYEFGLQDPAKALKELRRLGCWEDGQLWQAASWAVARIFMRGAVEHVLTSLQAWLCDERLVLREFGLVVVLRLAATKVSELVDLDLADEDVGRRWTRLVTRRRWPLLVALADEDEALLNPLVDLVWQVTRSASAQEAALDVLTDWLRAGEKDPSCVGPLGRFLALLGDDGSDRARLLHLVGVLRRDRDDPLPAALADYYTRAIEKNMHGWNEAGEA